MITTAKFAQLYCTAYQIYLIYYSNLDFYRKLWSYTFFILSNWLISHLYTVYYYILLWKKHNPFWIWLQKVSCWAAWVSDPGSRSITDAEPGSPGQNTFEKLCFFWGGVCTINWYCHTWMCNNWQYKCIDMIKACHKNMVKVLNVLYTVYSLITIPFSVSDILLTE